MTILDTNVVLELMLPSYGSGQGLDGGLFLGQESCFRRNDGLRRVRSKHRHGGLHEPRRSLQLGIMKGR